MTPTILRLRRSSSAVEHWFRKPGVTGSIPVSGSLNCRSVEQDTSRRRVEERLTVDSSASKGYAKVMTHTPYYRFFWFGPGGAGGRVCAGDGMTQ